MTLAVTLALRLSMAEVIQYALHAHSLLATSSWAASSEEPANKCL